MRSIFRVHQSKVRYWPTGAHRLVESSSSAWSLLESTAPAINVNNSSNTGRRSLLTSTTPNAVSSVSSQEVIKFSNMNQSWWDADKNPLIAMNPVRVGYLIKMLQTHGKGSSSFASKSKEPPLQNMRALDVGCGGGLLSESLSRLGADVTAIDPSVPLVEMAKERSQIDFRTRSINYQGGTSVEELAQEEPDKFDIICILEVLEHAADVDNLLQAACSLLKPPSEDSRGGMLFVSTLNKTRKSHALAIVGAEYVMGYLPVGTHDWEKFCSPLEMERRMNRVGLKPVNVSGMVLTAPWSAPPFSSWDWRLDETDVDVNWIGAYQHVPVSEEHVRSS